MRRLLACVAALLVAGCATVPPPSAGGAPIANKADPWENFNRKVYNFNDALDRDILKPVAQTYRRVLPQPVRTGVSNVLGNLYDVWSTANQFLQGKLQYGLEMGMRVATNTVFGIGGLLDPATEVGLKRRSEDFGQTLGWWGVPPGPYLVLPLFGPSTLRDAPALLVDRYFSPASLGDDGARYAIASVEIVSLRADLLGATDLLDQAALDRYSFVRDAWLARRRDLVFDGNAPPEPFEDEEPADAAAPAAKAASAPAAPASAPPK